MRCPSFLWSGIRMLNYQVQPHALDSSTFGFHTMENSDTSCFTNCSSNWCEIPKTLFGEQAEAIVEELASKGHLTLHLCFQGVSARLEGTDVEELKGSFVALVEARLVRRCDEISLESSALEEGIPKFVTPKDPFQSPSTSSTPEKSAEPSRKRKAESGREESSELWTINHGRFAEIFRDQLIVDMVSNVADECCAEIIRCLLKQSQTKPNPGSNTSAVLPANQLYRDLSDKYNRNQMEKSLTYILDLNNSFLKKVGDSGGGMLIIDYAQATENLCQSMIASLVKEKIGSKALRIFNLLLAKKFLEQNEIENLAMLPSKEGKALTYQLLSEQFIFAKEIAKTTDFAPSRTFYLFHVNLPMVARHVKEKAYKTMRNIVLRRQHEHEEHRSLVERQEKIEAIVANIQADETVDEGTKEQQISEIEEVYMTQAEKETLEQYRKGVMGLQKAEVEVEHSIFILQSYLQYKNVKIV